MGIRKMIRVIKIKEERSMEKVPAECCQRSSERLENKAMRRKSLVHGLQKGSHNVRHVMPSSKVSSNMPCWHPTHPTPKLLGKGLENLLLLY